MLARLCLLSLGILGCARDDGDPPSPEVRWLRPAETAPPGHAPGAQHRLVGTSPDGTRDFALVLASGDEVMTALRDLARAERIGNARISAVGAVRDAEVASFSIARRQYKAMQFAEQLEVVSLAGDITVAPDGAPSVHVHAALGRADGSMVGGHLIHATARPTLEVYVTAYPEPIHTRVTGETGTQVMDLGVATARR